MRGPSSPFPEAIVDVEDFTSVDQYEVLSLATLVEMDVAALRRLPLNAELHLPRQEAALDSRYTSIGAMLIPVPLLWSQDEWAVKAFVFVTHTFDAGRNYERYQCALHRLDGTPCRSLIDCDSSCRGRPTEAFIKHLRLKHAITEPPQRRKQQWQHGLFDCCCSTACFDFVLAPCCFSGRLEHVADQANYRQASASRDAVVSYATGALTREVGCFRAVCCAHGCWFSAFQWAMYPCGLFLMPCPADLSARLATVKLHNIDESCCDSCCIVCFCYPCSTIQVHREVASVGVWPGYTCFDRDEPPLTLTAMRSRFGLVTREDVVALHRRHLHDDPAMAAVIGRVVGSGGEDGPSHVAEAIVMQ